MRTALLSTLAMSLVLASFLFDYLTLTARLGRVAGGFLLSYAIITEPAAVPVVAYLYSERWSRRAGVVVALACSVGLVLETIIQVRL